MHYTFTVKTLLVSVFAISFLLTGAVLCQATERIPITTVSKEALDLYIQGRDLADYFPEYQ